MPKDLVIDTNVLVHANSDEEKRQQSSIDLITYLLSSSEVICVDMGFDLNEALNTSYVAYEYLKHLKYGMLGYTLIVALAQNRRIIEVPRNTPAHTTRKINQCMSNNHDRVFVKVAINSSNKTLVSHDFTDFAVSKREYLNKIFNIEVLVAADLC